MVGNKKRLQIALYPSGTTGDPQRAYHWALLIAPKNEGNQAAAGMRYHIKNPPGGGWVYEEKPVQDVRNTINLLVRITIAKIEDEQRLVQILRSVTVIQGNPDWRCRSWCIDAIAAIAVDGQAVGTAVLEWPRIEAMSRGFVVEKTQAGRFGEGVDMTKAKPVFDMLQMKETRP